MPAYACMPLGISDVAAKRLKKLLPKPVFGSFFESGTVQAFSVYDEHSQELAFGEMQRTKCSQKIWVKVARKPESRQRVLELRSSRKKI